MNIHSEKHKCKSKQKVENKTMRNHNNQTTNIKHTQQAKRTKKKKQK